MRVDSLSLVLDIPRELQEDEVKLIREVASAMDPANCTLLREEGRVLHGYNRIQPECSHSFHQRAESSDIRYMQDI